ncbi:tryparedoxin-like protein [Leishmania mexicana MHOM/GT/2001/U1103]|uniref:Tryparedoxin-like protein n=1 Tax=Leishmania mexicana (strain MHOM/GT/2001/U1103) TaxID=929439 RepID=E9B1Z6_LEIMU|nr:tryparedoxin-like protein [Leishmania mexicana MHOM/GT/2001/U1103]CBZ29253.1 tryparedoxin-like protein [Leishmania mexicana MHOM/GT/2001/U1103]
MSHLFENAAVELLRKEGTVAAAEALAGKTYVLVYFSAHWCPPCRSFTPKLKAFYEKHHVTHSFQVLFISSDSSPDEMKTYFNEAHGDWLALQYKDAQTIGREWAQQHGLVSIPSLLVLENNAERRLVTSYGRDMVLRDPEAQSFPWHNAAAIINAARRSFMQKTAAIVVLAILLLTLLIQ